MRQKDFDMEVAKRLRENKNLTENPFLPGIFFSIVTLVANQLFYVVLGVSLILTGVSFGLFGSGLLRISRKLLLF